jgi:hypothetical protein
VEIRESARKHGISDADIEHAVAHYLYTTALESASVDRFLYIGPDTAGTSSKLPCSSPPTGHRSLFTR